VLQARWIDGTESFSRLRPEWERLFTESGNATPFQSFEWCHAWWRHFGGRRRAYLICVREGNDLVGLAPMFAVRFPWRVLRAIGTGVSDYLHPLARSGYESQVAGAIRSHLAELTEYDFVDWHGLRESEPLASGLLSDRPHVSASCPVLDLPETWDAYLGLLSKSLRYEARRMDRPPYATGAATIRAVRDPAEVRAALGALFDLHGKRWKRRGLPGVFSRSQVRRFHAEYATEACALGRLRLSVLVHEGRPVGAIYAMRTGSGTYFYQSGFDPEAKSLSPGSVLVAATIRRAIEDGCKVFDFLRGEEPYKYRWGPQRVERNMRIVESLRPGLNRAAVLLHRTGGRVEAKLRAKFAGKGPIG
jgi:CelD/BcsL family acetyltransferase involved in cellulose biosynthesis